jgi:hypothetical protein
METGALFLPNQGNKKELQIDSPKLSFSYYSVFEDVNKVAILEIQDYARCLH